MHERSLHPVCPHRSRGGAAALQAERDEACAEQQRQSLAAFEAMVETTQKDSGKVCCQVSTSS